MEEGCRLFIEACRARLWCRSLLRVLKLVYGGLYSDDSHGLLHAFRVACNAFTIIDRGNLMVDKDVILAAALLHDAGRFYEKVLGRSHAEISADIARLVLPATDFPQEKIEAVARAILEHSYSKGLKPSSIESCVVSDADKLDALGIIGFYRLAYTSALLRRGMRDALRHYYEKLARLRELMCTSVARELAARREEELARIIRVFEEELNEYSGVEALLGY